MGCAALPLNWVTKSGWTKADAQFGWLGSGDRRSVPLGQTIEVGCAALPLNLVTKSGWTKADALFEWLDTGTWKSRLLDDGS